MKNIVSYFIALTFILGFTYCSDDDAKKVMVDILITDFETDVNHDDLKVTFVNQSKHATEYEWDFGDGKKSTEESPVHTYAVAGKYTVALKAVGLRETNSISKMVEVGIPEFTIDIDGDGSEWAAIPEEYRHVASIGNQTEFATVKEMRVTANKDFIFFYVKVNKEHANIMDIFVTVDFDDKKPTYYNTGYWNNPDDTGKPMKVDCMLRAEVGADSYDMEPYIPMAAGGWDWDGKGEDPNLFKVSNVKVLDGGHLVEYQAKLDRKLLKGYLPKLGGQIDIALAYSGIASSAWDVSGGLPIVSKGNDPIRLPLP